ncbi:GNAT family N-acetyltransferase [Neolewinella persica]|uniref:GNAT family N-acetyltransferase n=1 Tax=Neolewinella persica TaxID=70998 RepID=UPI0005C6DE93|nr:GNAT family N-acetyltransferase [Neolewinella persica]
MNLKLPQTTSDLTFRRAAPSDLPVLEHWDTLPHVIASDPDDDWEWEIELPRTVSWREQVMVELSGTPLGFLQIIDPLEEESHYWGGVGPNQRAIDVWIGPEIYLGKGYGTQMMRWAIDACFSDAAVEQILIDPLATNTRAHRFYERLGFIFLEERKMGDSVCFLYIMRRS